MCSRDVRPRSNGPSPVIECISTCMKAILTSIFVFALAVCVQAGTEQVTTTTVAPEQLLYGVGFYAAIDMGANVHQDRGGTRVFENEFGDTLTIEPKNNAGFYGGIKLGYVFGTGSFRPTVEGDFFYNGFKGGADVTLDENGVVTRGRSSTSTINTGAFMSNFIMRFGTGQFQPYVGGGIGIYYAESAGVDFSSTRGNFGTSGGAATLTSPGRLLPERTITGIPSSARFLSTTI